MISNLMCLPFVLKKQVLYAVITYAGTQIFILYLTLQQAVWLLLFCSVFLSQTKIVLYINCALFPLLSLVLMLLFSPYYDVRIFFLIMLLHTYVCRPYILCIDSTYLESALSETALNQFNLPIPWGNNFRMRIWELDRTE